MTRDKRCKAMIHAWLSGVSDTFPYELTANVSPCEPNCLAEYVAVVLIAESLNREASFLLNHLLCLEPEETVRDIGRQALRGWGAYAS